MEPNPNPPCRSATTRTVPHVGARRVVYCDIWESADVVYLGPSGCPGAGCIVTVGRLVHTGYANWFVCQHTSYASLGGINRAFTEADNGKWGWVDAWAYAGTASTWPLPDCDTTLMRNWGGGGEF